jgi:predicted nucleic acid-binding protein
MILVDTNVLLDIYKADPLWMTWSVLQLRRAKSAQLDINMVMYAELAGLAFRQFQQNVSTKTEVLPNFFIGAHELAEHFKLLTRDSERYKTYFRNVELICP